MYLPKLGTFYLTTKKVYDCFHHYAATFIWSYDVWHLPPRNPLLHFTLCSASCDEAQQDSSLLQSQTRREDINLLTQSILSSTKSLSQKKLIRYFSKLSANYYTSLTYRSLFKSHPLTTFAAVIYCVNISFDDSSGLNACSCVVINSGQHQHKNKLGYLGTEAIFNG